MTAKDPATAPPAEDGESSARESTPDLIAEIAGATGLDVLSARDLGGGSTTNLALLTPDGTVVARVHPATTRGERIAAEQAARRVLAGAGLPAVVACALVALPGGRHVELEPYVDAHGRMKTPQRLATGYTVLARVHDVLRAASLPPAAHQVGYANHVPARDAVALTRAGVEQLLTFHGTELGPFTEDLITHVEAVAAQEVPLVGCSPGGLTHGDFWDGNVLMAGGEVAAVVDFGFMADRPRIDDLALPFWFWLLEPGHGPPSDGDGDLLARLADAYDRGASAPLTADERAQLPLAVARQPAWSAHHWSLAPHSPTAAALARQARAELPVAREVLGRAPAWRRALAG